MGKKKFVIKNSITGEYVSALNMENTELEYMVDINDATIYDFDDDPPDELFIDNPGRLAWVLVPLEISESDSQDFPLSPVERKINDILSGCTLSESASAEKVIEMLGTEDEDIKNWVNRNFKQSFSVGDWVCYHATTSGPITSRGHRITKINKENGWAWITKKSGCVSVDNLSEDMDGHKYDTGELNPELAKGMKTNNDWKGPV